MMVARVVIPSGAHAQSRNWDSTGTGPFIGTIAIPRLRRYAAPLGMTASRPVCKFPLLPTVLSLPRYFMRRRPFASVFAVVLLGALPALSFAQSAPNPASRESG